MVSSSQVTVLPRASAIAFSSTIPETRKTEIQHCGFFCNKTHCLDVYISPSMVKILKKKEFTELKTLILGVPEITIIKGGLEMLLARSEIMSVAKEVINQYIMFILKKLGIWEKPENLIVKLGDSCDDMFGTCLTYFKDQKKNELAGAVVVLYINNITCIKILDWFRLPRLCMFSKKLLKRKILHVLAHELRHFWQYYTGEHKKYPRMTKGISQKVYLLEVDAENWAEEFLSAYVLKPKIARLSM